VTGGLESGALSSRFMRSRARSEWTLRLLTSAVATVAAACISTRPPSVVGHLSADESAILTALLKQEARHPEKPRPILVLTPTDPQLPPDLHVERPEGLPDEQWQQLREQAEVPQPLRWANDSAYALEAVSLPPSVTFYPRERFEREYESARKFDALVRRLGGIEPLVLSVSRPVIIGNVAFAALHVNATWYGCGGINLYALTYTEGTWHGQLKSVLMFW